MVGAHGKSVFVACHAATHMLIAATLHVQFLHDVATPQNLENVGKSLMVACQSKTKMPPLPRRIIRIVLGRNDEEGLPNSVFLPAHPWRHDRATRGGCSCHAVHALRHTHAGKAGHSHRACECRRACCPSHKHGYRTCQLHHLEQQRIRPGVLFLIVRVVFL